MIYESIQCIFFMYIEMQKRVYMIKKNMLFIYKIYLYIIENINI